MKNKKFVLGGVITGIALISALAFNTLVFPSVLDKTNTHVSSSTKATEISAIRDENQNVQLIYTPPKQEEYFQEMTKEEILLKMINSIDNFKTATGEFKVNYGQGEMDVAYKVSHQMKDNRQYDFGVFEKDSDSNSVTISNYKNDIYWTINEKDGTYNVLPSTPTKKGVPLTLNSAFTVDSEGIDVTDTRERPATPYAMGSLYPYEIASNYTRNLNNWDIEKQNESLLGHNTLLIKGKHSSSTFRFWIDKDTGILIKFETYNREGKVINYLYPVSLEVNMPVDGNDFTPNLDNLQKEDRYHSFKQGPYISSGGLDKNAPDDVKAQWDAGLKTPNVTTVFKKDGTWYIIPKVGYLVGSIEDGKIHLTKCSPEKSGGSMPSIAYNYGDKLTIVYDK